MDDADMPSAVCGLWALDNDHVFASGTNYPESPARFLKTTDGGRTWRARDMEDVATILVDIYFKDENVGWVVGGRARTPRARRDDVVPTVLKTTDGGKTWCDVLGDVGAPLGEWGWKIQFIDDQFGVVATENFSHGAILITEDGGKTWRRQVIRSEDDTLINQNLEGIGFMDRTLGWVGGWGDPACDSGRTSRTTDGGRTWTDLTLDWPKPEVPYKCPPKNNPYGQYINRFRTVGRPATVAYASGNTVYKFTDQPVFEPEPAFARTLGNTLLTGDGTIEWNDSAAIAIDVPAGAKYLSVKIYDRFAGLVRTLVNEPNPTPGQRSIRWDLTDDKGATLPRHQFLVRVSTDSLSESALIFRERPQAVATDMPPHMLQERTP
jgi:hypothetical protein